MQDHFDEITQRNLEDAQAFKDHDQDLCMLCHAYGADKRSLFVSCLYDVREVVPEFLNLSKVEDETLRDRGFYLRICKVCRSRLLAALSSWANESREIRDVAKDHDGYRLDGWDEDATIPVRINGATVMLTEEQYAQYRKGNDR